MNKTSPIDEAFLPSIHRRRRIDLRDTANSLFSKSFTTPAWGQPQVPARVG
jgi:hypothetical protein